MPEDKEKAKEYVLETTKNRDIKSIRLWFTVAENVFEMNSEERVGPISHAGN